MKYSNFSKSKVLPAHRRERTLRQAEGYLFQMALVFFTLIVLAACEQNNALQEDKQPTFTKRAKLYYVPTFALPFPPFLCCHIIETEDNEFFVADHALETFDEDNYDKFTYKKGIHAPVLDVIITYQIITKKKPPCSDDYFPPGIPFAFNNTPCSVCYLEKYSNRIWPTAMIKVIEIQKM